jgi:hypothetical protein
MTTEDFISELFYRIDETMRDIPKHPQASLWPSEIVTGAFGNSYESSGSLILSGFRKGTVRSAPQACDPAEAL